MAKWGEGDPRWLVEERPDATNVNNWHWIERNAAQWSKQKFNELFVGARISTDFGSCKITEIVKCDGDAVVNNRKAKLLFFYEWAIHMKWTGALINGDTVVDGTIEIINLSEEHDVKDVDIKVRLESSGPEAEILLEMMRTTGIDVLRECMSAYILALKEEFSKGLILPTKEPSVTGMTNLEKSKKNASDSNSKSKSDKASYTTGELTVTEKFKCTADEFYRVMTVKELVEAFTRSKCVLEPEEGGRFELFDGNVHGKFIQLVKNEQIKMKWRHKTWPEDCFSEVTVDVAEKSDVTEVKAFIKGVPTNEIKNTYEGWQRYYWESIMHTFGFGAKLF